MGKEKIHLLYLLFRDCSTFAFDEKNKRSKRDMKVDVYTAAVPRQIGGMDGMTDTHIRAFVNSCLPPPPPLTRYNILYRFATASGWSDGSTCLLTLPHTLADVSAIKVVDASTGVFRMCLTLTTRDEEISSGRMKDIH